MATKNAILKAMIEGTIHELMVKTNVDNVVLVDGSKETTLSLKLAEIISSLNSKATTTEMNTAISTAISDLVNGAPEAYNTLKEIADYLSSNDSVVNSINQVLEGKVSKEENKGLSTNDFTNDYKTSLDSLIAGMSEWNNAQANVIEVVKVNGTALTPDASKAVDISVPVIYAQTSTPSNMKNGDLFLQIVE